MSSAKGGGVSAPATNPIYFAPTSLSRMEVVVHTDGEQCSTSQAGQESDSIRHHGSMHDKPQGLNIEDDVERDVEK